MTAFAVTGASGQLSQLVVADLLDRGVAPADLVAVVRDATKARSLAEGGVQVGVAAYDQPDTLRAAFAGVDRLLLARRAVRHVPRGCRSTESAGRPSAAVPRRVAGGLPGRAARRRARRGHRRLRDSAGGRHGELDGDPADLERLLGRPATDLRTAVTRLVG